MPPEPRFRTRKPLQRMHSQRIPYLLLEKGVLRVDGHSFLFVQENEEFEFPGSFISILLLAPGTSITHEAVKLASENNTLLLWVGDGITRLYAVGYYNQNADRLSKQVQLHTVQANRLQAARRLYALMFDESPPPSYSIEKLRGIEGAKIHAIYRDLSNKHDLPWTTRNEMSTLNESISFATSCLYAICEAAILIAGYSPSIGIVHSGDPRSLVFDLADTVKFKTVVPLAFEVVKANPHNVNMAIRHACRNLFIRAKLIDQLISNLGYIIEATPCT